MPKNVFFSIPLAGKKDEAGWELICRLLGNTLRSIFAQTDSEFEVVITGHERPLIEELQDPRVTFLTAPFTKPVDASQFGVDKRKKRKKNAKHIRRRGGGYIVFLDADDLISRHLVMYMREKDDPNGYIFKHGYLLDYPTGLIAPVPGALPKTFDKYCGSCAAIHFAENEIGDSELEYKLSYYVRFKNHVHWEQVAASEGRPLQSVPFPAAIYVRNTSQSISSVLRSKHKLKTILEGIKENEITITSEIVEDFSLARVISSRSRS